MWTLVVVAGGAVALLHPFNALLAALFSDLFLIHVNLLGEFGPRNYAAAILLWSILASLILRGRLRMSPVLRRTLQVTAVMMCWIAIINVANGLPPARTLTILSLLAVSVTIGLATSWLVTTEVRLKRFLAFLFGALALSSFVAVMQYVGVDSFWQMRLVTGVDPESRVGVQILNQERVPGLAYYAIHLANQLVWVAPMAFGLLIARRRTRFLSPALLALTALLTAGVLVTLTRSALLGLLMGFAFIVVAHRGTARAPRVGLVVLLAAALGTVALVGFSESRLYSLETASSRSVMALAAFRIWLLQPLGAGTGQFSSAAAEIYPQIQHIPGASEVLITAAHNQFLNTLVYYGIPGLVLLLGFYVVLVRSLWRSNHRATTPWMRGLALGLVGGYAAYLVNSLFHNAGAFIGDPFHWYFVGLTGALEVMTLSGRGRTSTAGDGSGRAAGRREHRLRGRSNAYRERRHGRPERGDPP